MRTTVEAMTTAMISMKPRHMASDFKRPDRSWPALVQNRHTMRLIAENARKRRSASAAGLRPMEKPADAAMVTAHILGFTA